MAGNTTPILSRIDHAARSMADSKIISPTHVRED